jgi:hypothetical protein
MDGLSVSVVPTERAGMAAGIFSTMRVAGEGIALALVSALLAALLAHHLGSTPPASQLAQQLIAGKLDARHAGLPAFSHGELVAAYLQAFRQLCLLLAGITIACAVAVQRSLRPTATLP